MLSLLQPIKNMVKIKKDSSCIDNWVFKLHYRGTTIILLISTLLVTSKEVINDRIRCLTESNYQKFLETYCFFSATLTVVDNDVDNFRLVSLPYYGVVPYHVDSGRPIRKHLYYQWVPYVLFGQAMVFYMTHLFWKQIENGRICKMVSGLSEAVLASLQKNELKEKKSLSVEKIRSALLERMAIDRSWTKWLMTFEILNLLNVVSQIYVTDRFLGGHFHTLGTKMVQNGSKILDEVFPKVTKCTFHKYGHSGTIETHDSLCVMSLNIVNEKIYVFLWFWFLFLLVTSSISLIWRLLTIILYSRSRIFNQMVFGFDKTKMYPWFISRNYWDWLFLKYLSKNLDSYVFRELFGKVERDEGKDFVTILYDQEPCKSC